MPFLKRFDFGHRAAPVAIWTLLASCALDIYMYVSTANTPMWLLPAAGLMIMVVLIGSLVALFFHGRRLCEPCIRDMPLDCAAKAKRNYWHFWFIHTLDRNKKIYWACILALIVASFIFNGLIGLILGVVFKLAGVEIIYGSVAHKKLQPWCPWCGERGIEVKRNSPVLQPLGVR